MSCSAQQVGLRNSTGRALQIAWLDSTELDGNAWVDVPAGDTALHSVPISIMQQVASNGVSVVAVPGGKSAGSYVAVRESEEGGVRILYVGHALDDATECPVDAGSAKKGEQAVVDAEGGMATHVETVFGAPSVSADTATSVIVLKPYQEHRETAWAAVIAGMGCVALGTAIYLGVRAR